MKEYLNLNGVLTEMTRHGSSEIKWKTGISGDFVLRKCVKNKKTAKIMENSENELFAEVPIHI